MRSAVTGLRRPGHQINNRLAEVPVIVACDITGHLVSVLGRDARSARHLPVKPKNILDPHVCGWGAHLVLRIFVGCLFLPAPYHLTFAQTYVNHYIRVMKKPEKKPHDPNREPYFIGYARVSMADQNPQLQIDALVKAGVPRDRIYFDQASGSGDAKRPKFDLMMKDAREGDVVVIWKLDRLGRNVRQVLDTFAELHDKGARVKVITQDIDTTTVMGRLIVTIMAAVAEMERDLIRERTKAGLAAAKAEGRVGGRRSKLTDEFVLSIAHLSPSSAMKRTGLTRTGWFRRLEKAQERAAIKAAEKPE